MQTRYLPSAHSDVNNNDRYFQARSIDRGDLYRTCTPNVIRNDCPAFHWHSVRELPTDRPRQLQQRHLPLCLVSRVCPDTTNQPARPALSTATCIALPSLF